MNANPFLRKINVVLEKTGLDAYSLQIENSQGIEFYINFPKKKIPPSSSTPHSTSSPPSKNHRSRLPSNKTSTSSSFVGSVSHYFDNYEKDSTSTLLAGNLDNDI